MIAVATSSDEQQFRKFRVLDENRQGLASIALVKRRTPLSVSGRRGKTLHRLDIDSNETARAVSEAFGERLFRSLEARARPPDRGRRVAFSADLGLCHPWRQDKLDPAFMG
jgi:hypothetical protein